MPDIRAMPRSMTEEEFDQFLEDAGVSRIQLQRASSELLGIPGHAADIETAEVIVGGAWPGRIRGCMRCQCARCACFLAISPSSQRAIAERPSIRVLCIGCARIEASEVQDA